MRKTLVFRLSGLLQSYALQNYYVKPTNLYPTKTAVLGMIAAALGYDASSKADEQKILDLNNLLFAVRSEQDSKLMTDYQIMSYQGNNAKQSYHDYLQDAVFLVAIGSNSQKIDEIEYALHHPKFVLYLGRKSNPPAGILKTEKIDEVNPAEVLLDYPWQASEWFKNNYYKKFYYSEIVADASLLPDKNYEILKTKIGSWNSSNFYHKAGKLAKIDVAIKNSKFFPERDFFAEI